MGFSSIRIKALSDDEEKIVYAYGLWEKTDGVIIYEKKTHMIRVDKPCSEDSGLNEPLYAKKAAIKIASGKIHGEITIRTG